MERRSFIVPLDNPAPFREGDRLPNGTVVCRFSDRYVLGGWVVWTYYVQVGCRPASFQAVDEPRWPAMMA